MAEAGWTANDFKVIYLEGSVMWVVDLHAAFLDELLRLHRSVRIAIFANIGLLEAYGPRLGRPQVDTLAASKYRNMKEMRITVPSGEWRVAFAFDPRRAAILLVAAKKSGVSQSLFYKRLLQDADRRYGEHLRTLDDRSGR
jgi:hypothetical protein